jgi:anti-sigma regulatory factor (Ser/Thr protein kinase)
MNGPGKSRFRHDAAIFSSPEEMIGTVVPFLDEAVERGIPAYVRLEDDLAAMVRERLAEPDGVGFAPGASLAHPLRALRAMNDGAIGDAGAGAEEIRLVGCIPQPSQATPQDWEQWARYEAALNRIYADVPIWGLCCYVPPPPAHARDDVLATHSGVLEHGRWRSSEEYVEPSRWLAGRAPASVERLDEQPPAFELTNPDPAEAREVVARLAARAGLRRERADDLVLAVNEVVTNAFLHGRPPVTLRGWSGRDGVLVAVRDHGTGLGDEFAGVMPPRQDDRTLGGRGVPLARMCSDLMSLRLDADGFTVRLAVWGPGQLTWDPS